MTSAYKTLRSDKFISIMMIVFGICEAIIPLLANSDEAYRFYFASLFYFIPPTGLATLAVGILSILCGIFSLKTGRGHTLLMIVFTLCLFVSAFLVSISSGPLKGWLYSIPIVQNHVLILGIIHILFLLLDSLPALLAAFSIGPIASIIVSVCYGLNEITYFLIYNDMKQTYLFIIVAQSIISVAVVSYVTYRYGYGRNGKRLLLSLFCGLTDGSLVNTVFNSALLFIIAGKLTGPGLSSIILFVLACIWHIVIIWDGKRNLSKKEITESCQRD